ncbi:DUF551 domain-containing protein [Serratia ureilytica]|uniref:DUF551 domain-containing protein n=1 Tax=Serratia ureilytica TaxID=300181 RepID=UPI003FA72598
MTLTTEQLKERAEYFRNKAATGASSHQSIALLYAEVFEELMEARELLANREAQPVGIGKRSVFTCSFCGAQGLDEPLESRCHCMGDGAHWVESALYTAPPAPAVPGIDELRLAFERAERESDDGFNLHKYGIGYADEATQARWESWLACRAAMLTEAKCECSSIDYCENCLRAMLAQPVSSGHKLADGWIACSERMPVDTQTVLCSNLLTELSGIPFIADYVGEFQLYDGTKYESGFYINRELQTVTHWMPLPAAPEGGMANLTARSKSNQLT